MRARCLLRIGTRTGSACSTSRRTRWSKILKGGPDPENFDVSFDGKTIYVSNEDASGVSFIDIASGTLTKTIKTGEEPEGVKLTPDGKLIYSTAEGDGTVAVDRSGGGEAGDDV